MAEVKWNEEQKQAIDARDCSVLVSAAAGSGKTAVLVERVIQLLTDKSSGVMADELLIVTFTNLAAEEMKTRINKRITDMLDVCKNNPDIDEKHLRNQQLLLDKAYICTIDSFCKNIVKTAYTRFDISPDYRIGDTSELTALQCLAVEEVAEEYYLRSDFRDIASLLTTSTNDNTLKATVINFYSFLSALPFPQQWMEQTLKNLESAKKDVIHCVWIENIVEKAKQNIKFAKGVMDNSCDIFLSLEQSEEISEKSPAKKSQHLSEKAFINALQSCKSWSDIQGIFETNSDYNTFFERSATIKNLSEDGKELYENYKDNRNTLKDLLSEMKTEFSATENELENELEKIIDITKVLFEFINDFTERYTQLKKEKNILDFADIERFTLLTLADVDKNGEFAVDNKENSIRYNITDEAKALAQSFKQVIVDEYQDVNQLQDLIFKIISNNDKNLFVVGDVKQSIYGFRQAMPDIFIDRRKLYNSVTDLQARNIVLKKNYRSRNGVTDYVNFVFANLMKKEVGNLEYAPEDYLISGASYIGENNCDVYIHLNNLPQKNKKMRDLYEAKQIVKIIKDSVGKYDVTSGDTTRKADYKDVAILMRSVKDTTTIVEYLQQCNIPVVTETKSSLLDCKEVQMVIDLLRVIDNPLQDIPLYSVLVSPMFGFTPQQIAQLRNKEGRKSLLYKNVLAESKTNTRFKDFIEDIEYYREISANNPTDYLINIIYRRTAITEFAKALEDGEVVLNNLRLLYNYSRSFENDQNKGVSSFIRYIDHAIETGAVLDAQTGSNTDGNAVRIMTMHHSKGLEFPVCILANIGRQPLSYKDKVYFDRDLGIGLQIKDYETSAVYKTFPYRAIINKMKNDSVAEELRVLYVALTRAREQLHLVGSYQNLPKVINKISLEIALNNEIKSDTLIKHNSMLDWIIAVTLLMKPQKGQHNNILWQYANSTFLEKIAYNPDFKSREYKDIFVEIFDVLQNDEQKSNEETNVTEKALNTEEIVDRTISNATDKTLENPTIDTFVLDKRFNEIYKYQSSVDVPSVVTPSSIVHRNYTILDNFVFEEKDTLTPAERGTAMHLFMEHANLETAVKEPQSEIDRLVKNGYLSEKQGRSINSEYVIECLNTSIMQRYMKSSRKYKEVKFEAMVKAGVTGFKECNEEHLLRGAVDCAFEEDGEIVIIDYKTDRVKEIEKLKEKYSVQLELYKIGLSASLNIPVKQCVIYSFYLNDFIEV